MNQILFVNKDNNTVAKKAKNKSSKKFYKTQFVISILLFVITIATYMHKLQNRNAKEKVSQQIASNYNISKLYNNNETYNNRIYNRNGQTFAIIGLIEIPKINIYYPIISEASDELLKISPCRISGPMPNENGNLCIAGHNYDNYKFFSKVSDLQIDDQIIIYDTNGNKFSYRVFDIYEVLSSDLSPLENSNIAKKQVTLVTCNNFNSDSRIIIKALYN